MSRIDCLLVVVFLALLCVDDAQAASVRYRQGRLLNDKLLAVKDNLSVAAARQYCHDNEECVSFGFESSATRFPAISIRAYFYRYADWHVLSTGQAAFVEDPAWHLYVNTTREVAAVPEEVETILKQLDKIWKSCQTEVDKTKEKEESDASKNSRRLRSSSASRKGESVPEAERPTPLCVQQQTAILDAIFHIVYTKEIKAVAAPYLIPKMLQQSTNTALHRDIRIAAANNLIVIADAQVTAPMLVDAGVYEAMKVIVTQERNFNGDEWEGLPILALDCISNIIMYRHPQANEQLRQKGAPQMLQQTMDHATGFPALQSVLALLHLGSSHAAALPQRILEELVQLLANSIDGDVVYGILWDLIPGPLSAIQLLIQQQQKSIRTATPEQKEATATMMDHLLDAGLVEQLLRILEVQSSTCGLVAAHTEAVLEILDGLAHLSQRAREMIWMTASTIKQAQQTLQAYQRPATLAKELTTVVSSHDYFQGFRAHEL